MTELEAYIQFRKEIDTMFYPEYAKRCDVTTRKDDKGNVIGLLIVDDYYIDSLWVDEKHRGQGIGYQLVCEHVLTSGMPLTLRILNNNQRAHTFWNKVFRLHKLESNPYDSLYQILGLRDSKEVK